MSKTIVVLPTYNEAENLPLIVKALFELDLPNFEILVVDDNSPDGTGQIAESLRSEYDELVHVLHRPGKGGLGPAYKAGFSHAMELGADILVQMDSDFSHQPHYLPQLLDAIEGRDVVIGSRFVKGGGVDHNWGIHRKLLSWWANRVYTPTLLGMPIYDATGGFRVWRRETLQGLGMDRVRANGYVFQVEMIYVAYRLGYSWTEVPIYFPDRLRGESKMSPNIAFEAAMRVWEIRGRHHHLTPADRASLATPARV